MKLWIPFVLSFFFMTVQDLPDVRERYNAASKTRQDAKEFYNLLSGYNKNDATMLAYKGAAMALKSKFESDRKLKRDLFIEGVKLIESAVGKEPANAEIRLVRLSIQENTPKFLKYKQHIGEDKKLIINAFNKLPNDLKEHIKGYVSQSKVFTEQDKKHFFK